MSRNNTFTNPIFPLGGSEFVLSARFSLPYSLWNGVDYGSLGELPEFQDSNGDPDQSKIDQEKYKWLEFYKIKFDGSWYTRLFGKFVLKAQTDFGFLGTYNSYVGNIPFERFYLGGDGLSGSYSNFLLGTERIALRGYENNSLVPYDIINNIRGMYKMRRHHPCFCFIMLPNVRITMKTNSR